MEDGGYVFKPPYHLRGRKDLLRLLNRHDQQGLGGIMMDDIVESLPNAEKSIGVSALYTNLCTGQWRSQR